MLLLSLFLPLHVFLDGSPQRSAAGCFNPVLMTSRCLSTWLYMSYPEGVRIGISWQDCVCVFCWKRQLVAACWERLGRTAAALGDCYRSLQLLSVFTHSQHTKLPPCSFRVGCGKNLIMVFACGLCARVCTDGVKKAVGLIGTCTDKRKKRVRV